MGFNLKMRLWRGDKSGGELQDYEVQAENGEVVLDAIHRVQATQAGDLAVRWNCKAGKCGSCSAEINGKPALLCMTRLSDFEPTDTITVTPLRSFPIVRDLVTDVTFNYEKAAELPSFNPPPRDADGIFPHTLYALHTAGADEIFCIGGVQAMASMVFGRVGMRPVDMITGLPFFATWRMSGRLSASPEPIL